VDEGAAHRRARHRERWVKPMLKAMDVLIDTGVSHWQRKMPCRPDVYNPPRTGPCNGRVMTRSPSSNIYMTMDDPPTAGPAILDRTCKVDRDSLGLRVRDLAIEGQDEDDDP
jgi:hypothetical protein